MKLGNTSFILFFYIDTSTRSIALSLSCWSSLSIAKYSILSRWPTHIAIKMTIPRYSWKIPCRLRSTYVKKKMLKWLKRDCIFSSMTKQIYVCVIMHMKWKSIEAKSRVGVIIAWIVYFMIVVSFFFQSGKVHHLFDFGEFRYFHEF